MESYPLGQGSFRLEEEEEVCSHVLVRSQGWDKKEELAHGAIGRAQQAFLEQMTQMLHQVTEAIPQPPPPPQPQPVQRSPLEKLRKYGAVDFNGKKEDDPATVEH